MKYVIVILIVFLAISFVQMNANPYYWHLIARSSAVLLIGVGIYFVDKGNGIRKG